MIDKEGAHCSRCSVFEESNGRSFREMVDAIKSLGWRITKVGNVWIHYCPACAEAKNTDRRAWQRPAPAERERQWWHD